MPGGALSPDGKRWIETKPRFLFKVTALSKVFRTKYLSGLKATYEAGQLRFAGGTAELAAPPRFKRWLEPLWQQDWWSMTSDRLRGLSSSSTI